MLKYAVRFLVARGDPLSNPLPPNPTMVNPIVERLSRQITARDPDDAMHLVGHRYCMGHNLEIIHGPNYVTNINDNPTLSHSPDHFSTTPPNTVFNLAIPRGMKAPFNFIPLRFKVLSATPVKDAP